MVLIGCLLLVATIEAILEFVSVEHFACWCIRTAELMAALSECHIFLHSKDKLFSTMIKHQINSFVLFLFKITFDCTRLFIDLNHT